jgi:hypothetical protein
MFSQEKSGNTCKRTGGYICSYMFKSIALEVHAYIYIFKWQIVPTKTRRKFVVFFKFKQYVPRYLLDISGRARGTYVEPDEPRGAPLKRDSATTGKFKRLVCLALRQSPPRLKGSA